MVAAKAGGCRPEGGRWLPVIDRARCEGKQTCVRVCPYDVLEMRPLSDADKQAMSMLARLKARVHGNVQAFAVRPYDCHACGLCVTACPEQAITLALRGGPDER